MNEQPEETDESTDPQTHAQPEEIGDRAEAKRKTRGRGRGRPFRPGQSGNPGGRPGSWAEFRELCRVQSAAAIEALMTAVDEGGPAGVAAAKVVLAYAFGKPPDDPVKALRG
jgi:hypothetical protein